MDDDKICIDDYYRILGKSSCYIDIVPSKIDGGLVAESRCRESCRPVLVFRVEERQGWRGRGLVSNAKHMTGLASRHLIYLTPTSSRKGFGRCEDHRDFALSFSAVFEVTALRFEIPRLEWMMMYDVENGLDWLSIKSLHQLS